MIKGVKALFCTGLALLDYLAPSLLDATDLGINYSKITCIGQIFMLFDEAQKN